MQRTVFLNGQSLSYILTRKKVKNLNLRIQQDGSIAVSAAMFVPADEIDRFVLSRFDWIINTKKRLAVQTPAPPLPACNYTDADCDKVLGPFIKKYLPLFAPAVGGELLVVYRTMKSRWGVCCPAKRRITLNRRLLDKSAAAQEYVVLHEFVHFHHLDHQKGFYAELSALMPDYKERKKELRTL